MSGDPLHKFSIANYTGALTLVGSLTYKIQNYYSLYVRVTDLPTSQGAYFSTSPIYTYVNITVIDINHAPVFDQPLYNASILEQVATGTFLIQVHAADTDSIAINAAFGYNIVSGNPGNAFAINASTGAISTSGALAKATQSSYSLVIAATDSGNPSLSGYATVNVAILNANNHPPV